MRNSELDKLKIENGKCKIEESAALTDSQGGKSLRDGFGRLSIEPEGPVSSDSNPEGRYQLPAGSRQQAENRLSADSSQQAEEGSVPEIVVPKAVPEINAIPEPEEPCIVIHLGNGETVCVSVQYAKFMLANPNIETHPELKEALREFVESASGP